MHGVVSVADVVRTIATWNDLSPEAKHAYVKDPARVSETLQIMRERDSKRLQNQPQVLLGGATKERDLSDTETRGLIDDEVVQGALHSVAATHQLDVRKDAIHAMRTGLATFTLKTLSAASLSAAQRWLTEASPRTSWERPSNPTLDKLIGLNLLFSVAEGWCGGAATPTLQKISKFDEDCFVIEEAVVQPLRQVAAVDAQKTTTEEETTLPYAADHLEDYLKHQVKAVLWRAQVAEEMLLDSCSEAYRFEDVEDMARGAKDIIIPLLDDTEAPRNKAHPIWTYVYATHQLKIEAEAERSSQAEAERIRLERKRKADEMQASRQREEQLCTTRTALGIKRGLLIKNVKTIRSSDFERGALLL